MCTPFTYNDVEYHDCKYDWWDALREFQWCLLPGQTGYSGEWSYCGECTGDDEGFDVSSPTKNSSKDPFQVIYRDEGLGQTENDWSDDECQNCDDHSLNVTTASNNQIKKDPKFDEHNNMFEMVKHRSSSYTLTTPSFDETTSDESETTNHVSPTASRVADDNINNEETIYMSTVATETKNYSVPTLHSNAAHQNVSTDKVQTTSLSVIINKSINSELF